jgi:hypothetical protein
VREHYNFVTFALEVSYATKEKKGRIAKSACFAPSRAGGEEFSPKLLLKRKVLFRRYYTAPQKEVTCNTTTNAYHW